MPLAGCGTKGFSIESAVPDRSVVTGSIPQQAPDASDEITISNAVSSAVVDEIGEAGLGWANVATGSRGTIREVRENRAGNGLLCRSFTASRESYEGIHLYRGETCMSLAKQWAMHRFERVE